MAASPKQPGNFCHRALRASAAWSVIRAERGDQATTVAAAAAAACSGEDDEGSGV